VERNVTWNLGTNSVFAIVPRETTDNRLACFSFISFRGFNREHSKILRNLLSTLVNMCSTKAVKLM
jgi:hypothetical protein